MPTSSISPSSVTLMEGSDITLECRTSGTPSPDVNWDLGNLVTSYQQYNLNQHYTTLKMINVSSNDTGKTILCIAENIVGENESSVILVVHFPPKITFLGQAVLDHHWCIPFSARGNPKPKLIWFYEGAVLNETDFIWTSIHLAFDSEHHGCLQLDSPTHLNNGQYTLLAKNDYGTDERTVSAHFMPDPWLDYTSDPASTNVPDMEPDSIAVYVVVGIAAVAFTGFVLMLIILKFGRNSKFGIKAIGGFGFFFWLQASLPSRRLEAFSKMFHSLCLGNADNVQPFGFAAALSSNRNGTKSAIRHWSRTGREKKSNSCIKFEPEWNKISHSELEPNRKEKKNRIPVLK
ncbi:UNVERIFIED_CONTAM: hypothetical protein FKN15_051780 [Acipenser sinensis]